MERPEERPRFLYVRDDRKHRVTVTACGPMSLDDFCAVVDRQAEEGTWSYGMLYDLQRLPVPLPGDEADLVAARVYRHIIACGARGPVALVSSAPHVVGALQLYTFYTARAGVTMQVFWDCDEADAWLDEVGG